MAEDTRDAVALSPDDRVLVILAPASLDKLPFLKQHLAKVFPRVDVISPADLDDLQRIVGRSAATHRLVLAAGGDGTLHQVLQRLDTGAQVLGVLPIGTGNDFARSFDFPAGLAERIKRLGEFGVRQIDFATANGRRYINSGGFGIDSQTLKTRQRSRGFIARNYNAAFLVTLLRLQYYQAEVNCDGERLDGEYCWILAMNSPYIGGGTKIAPRSAVDSGQLDMLLVKRTGKLSLLSYLPAAIKGTHLELAPTIYRQARRIDIRLSEPLDYLALDGELTLCGSRTIEFEVKAGELMFLG
jgi:YegS/Rv2252/BmrU family lipid kinase